MVEEERSYKVTVEINVLGYLLGGGDNEEKPMIVYRESAVQVLTPRERSVLADKPEHAASDSRRLNQGFFRDDPHMRIELPRSMFPGDLPPDRGPESIASPTTARARTAPTRFLVKKAVAADADPSDAAASSNPIPDPPSDIDPFESC